MTLEQLRIFVAVAEREHVTAAARRLGLTQSAVSNAVAALEARRASAEGELNVVYRRSDGHVGWIDPSKLAAGLAERA